MNSVERVLEYSSQEPEAPDATPADDDVPAGWPAKGAISVQVFSVLVSFFTKKADRLALQMVANIK